MTFITTAKRPPNNVSASDPHSSQILGPPTTPPASSLLAQQVASRPTPLSRTLFLLLHPRLQPLEPTTMNASLPVCLKRCMPSTDLNSLLVSSFSDCSTLMSDGDLFLDDDSVALRSKRQRTSGGEAADSDSDDCCFPSKNKNPATEALEAILSSDDELFAFDFDFEPTSVLQVPSLALSFHHHFKGHHHHDGSFTSKTAVSEVTCGFARLSTGTATRAA